MSRGTRVLWTFIALVALARVAEAKWPHDPNVNVPLCTAAGAQSNVTMVSDGLGGAIVVWVDFRSGLDSDVYAQHVLSSGEVDPDWPSDGLAVCDADSNQYLGGIVPDGSGGVIVAWADGRNGPFEGNEAGDVYAQHVLSSGQKDPAWPVEGLAVCTVQGDKWVRGIVSDGMGDAIVAWEDKRTGAYDIYAQRVLASGQIDTAWPINGLEICDEPGTQRRCVLATDGAGGAIAAWEDFRSGEADIYAQRVLVSGQRAWIGIGRALCTAPDHQFSPAIVSDGVGGAIVVWEDYRDGVGPGDLYAQHVLASGTLNPAYPANVAVCTAIGFELLPLMVSDGSGGAIVAWHDNRVPSSGHDVYAHHIQASGTVDPTWPADGTLLASTAYSEEVSSIISDGAGGAIVAWTKKLVSGGNTDVYAQHVTAAGLPDVAVWGIDGHAISTAAAPQYTSHMVSDGARGAIMAWPDHRSGQVDIYSQRIARFGRLGSPEPEIVAVRDVPNDQGGQVSLAWDASWLDTDPIQNIVDHYWILRALIRTGSKQAAPSSTLPWAEATAKKTLKPGTLLVQVQGSETYYWEYLDSVSALHIVPGYSYRAATTGDSTSIANPMTHFMVIARNESGDLYWPSAPDSGYSVDNLAPLAPQALKLEGDHTLTWKKNSEQDLDEYVVYANREITPGLSSDERVGSTKSMSFVLPETAAGCYVWVTAVDIHGNESAPSNIVWSGEGIEGRGVPAHYFLSHNVPNPFNPMTTIRFGLPRAGPIVLSVYDLSGRRIAVLADGHFAAGEFREVWDGRDAWGVPVASGIYFARLQAEGFESTRKMVLIR